MTEHSPDPYKVLHLGRAATAREIGRAYRALVRTRHPDARPAGALTADPDSTAQDQQELQELQELQECRNCRRLWMPTPFSVTLPSGPPTTGNGRTTPPPEPAPRHRDPGPYGPDLIIGPVRWESPTAPGTPAPGRRLLWWIRF